MTGFRIGYLVADEKFIQGVYKLQSHLMGNLCSFAQNGAIAALDLENHFVDSMLDQLKKQRDLGHKLFAGLFDCSYPHGALYLYLNVKKYYNESIKTSADFAEYILKNAHVALLPSEYFGGQDYVRLSFATSEDDLQQAFERIKLLLL